MIVNEKKQGEERLPLFDEDEEKALFQTLKPAMISFKGVSLYVDQSPRLFQKACTRLGQNADDMAHLVSFAFVFENKIIGILSWTDYRPEHDMWWTIYSVSAYWCTKKVLDYLFNTAFEVFHVTRVNALTKTDNLKAISLLERLGFEREGRLKKFYPEDKKDAYLWAKFL
ncbi:MAG: GNAT family N-acetyltransferase [Alphaproteobacteria bacterium]|nr:GNAT family N-acetyltransferase [Alphaproteobacteria bacterium]